MNHRVVCTAAIALLAGAPSHAQTFRAAAGAFAVETFARGLVYPWSLAFLPDGRMLVTEKPGRMRIVSRDGQLSPPLAGVPRVYSNGQPGLLDVILDRDFAGSRTIYFCYSVNRGGTAAIARARLNDGEAPRLDDVKLIFTQEGPGGSNNYGCRIVQAPDGNLFVTLGDHFEQRNEAQNLANHIGKIIRIRPDGSAPPDNPFVGRPGAKPEELRLARDRLWHRLQRRQDPREHAQARHGAAAVVLGALDRALRHGLLYGRSLPAVERQSVHRRAAGAAPRPPRA